MSALTAGLKKLNKGSQEDIQAWLKTVKWKHEELFALAMEQREPFRSKLLRAQLEFPFSKNAKGPAGFAIPHDRWAALAAANQIAYDLIAKKDAKNAAEFLAPYAKYAKEFPFIGRNLAVAYAQTGRANEAVKQLALLAAQGWEWMTSLETEPALKAIHEHAGFKALFAKWQKSGRVKNGYDVNVDSLKKTFPKSFAPPRLLLDFCALSRTLPYGSIGYFTLGGSDYPYFPKKKLGAHFAEFMTLGEGSEIAFWRSGDTWDAHPAIVMLGSEGEYSLLASSFEDFVLKIARKATGEDDIDRKYDDGDGPDDRRDDLKARLKKHNVKAPKVAKRPPFQKWIASRLPKE